MALILTKSSSFGVDVSYWKITGYKFFNDVKAIGTGNPIGIGLISVEISGWKDKAARDALYAPLLIKSIVMDEDYADKAGMYGFLKKHPDFQGATDEV